jgi:transposase InsO family protein
MDRDTKFSAAFRDVLAQADVESVVLPPRSPNLNAHMERFFGSLKAECLDRLIFFGEGMLRRTVREYVQHYIARNETTKGSTTRSSRLARMLAARPAKSNAASVCAVCFVTTIAEQSDRSRWQFFKLAAPILRAHAAISSVA